MGSDLGRYQRRVSQYIGRATRPMMFSRQSMAASPAAETMTTRSDSTTRGSTWAAASLIWREVEHFLAQPGVDGHSDTGQHPAPDPRAKRHDDAGDRHGHGAEPALFGSGARRQPVDEAADRPRSDESGPGVGQTGEGEEGDP